MDDLCNDNHLINLSDKELKIAIWKMFQEVKESINQCEQNTKAEIRKLQTEMAEIKNTVASLNSRVTAAEERIGVLEDEMQKNSTQQKKWEKNLRTNDQAMEKVFKECERMKIEVFDKLNRNNIRIIGVPETQVGDVQEESTVKDIIKEILPELTTTCNQILHARRVPAKRDPKKNTPRHIIVTMTNPTDRDRILNAARSKREITFKGASLRLTADMSKETLNARKQWWDIVTRLNEMNASPRILYPARLTFRFKGRIHGFMDKQQLKNFADDNPDLKEKLIGLL